MKLKGYEREMVKAVVALYQDKGWDINEDAIVYELSGLLYITELGHIHALREYIKETVRKYEQS